MNMRLENLREEKELLGKEMANYLGVVESVYSEWENEKLTIPTKRLIELANFFEINIDYMLGLSNNRKKMKAKEIDYNKVSLNLKKKRKELKMSMRDLAKKLNTTSSAISNYENNKFLILGSFLIELSKSYNYSIDWILGRSNEKFINKKTI